MTRKDMLKQFANAIERAERTYIANGEKATSPDDKYGGLMWYDDADQLSGARRFILEHAYNESSPTDNPMRDASFVLYMISAFIAGATVTLLASRMF